MLRPRSFKRLYFRNVKRGDYVFEVQHSDKLLLSLRRGLIAKFILTTCKVDNTVAQQMGLSLGDDRRAFAYLGGGRASSENVRQRAKITVPQDQRWLCIDLATPLDRVINIDRVSLSQTRRYASDAWDSHITAWLEATPKALAAEFLLFGDIDLNVVDGSSVWLSSMASIVCGLGRCILLAKRDVRSEIVLSNIEHRHNLFVVSPRDLGRPGDLLDVNSASEILRALDARLPSVRNVIVRGTDAATELLATRQFRQRALIYLTDFYEIEGGRLVVPPERVDQLSICAIHASKLLIQTAAIGVKLQEVTGLAFEACEMPPVIPDNIPSAPVQPNVKGGAIRFGYAGKIAPGWGIDELLDWTQRLRAEGHAIELHVVANKISYKSVAGELPGFRDRVREKLARARAVLHDDFNRERAMKLMAEMDYVWCWRPSQLEDNTPELSTKLVETVACGGRCICYPANLNVCLLGETYPFFARSFDDVRRIVLEAKPAPTSLKDAVRDRHSVGTIREELARNAFNRMGVPVPRRICFAGHDFKFIDPYISYLKATGHEVRRDVWRWGEAIDTRRSLESLDWAEVVFCEWGLANAVWYSRHTASPKRLFIRLHLQEIGERARHLAQQIDFHNVERIIFVSETVREQALKIFGWPEHKTLVIPNFVLADEYRLVPRKLGTTIRLGLAGIVPQRKRLDQAVELLAELKRRGHDAHLYVKGPRPETLSFMRAPGRVAELDYYRAIYEQIEADPHLSRSIQFDPWANDMALWYRKIDHIISCSDFESFHYALADGVLSGCHPVVWPWEGADRLYSPDWIIANVTKAADRIEEFRALPSSERESRLVRHRTLVEDRYGFKKIFVALDNALGLTTENRTLARTGGLLG